MYYSISGTIVKRNPSSIVLENHGIAYELTVSLSTLDHLPDRGEQGKLFTYLHVREDILRLFGFFHQEEKDLFLKLISMSGIGPKNAINILSGISVNEFKKIILNGDVKRLNAIPGIGPKTAKRLIIELKDKMTDKEISEVLGGGKQKGLNSQAGDALAALESLGYRKSDVQQSVEDFITASPDSTTEIIIRHILKKKNK